MSPMVDQMPVSSPWSWGLGAASAEAAIKVSHAKSDVKRTRNASGMLREETFKPEGGKRLENDGDEWI